MAGIGIMFASANLTNCVPVSAENKSNVMTAVVLFVCFLSPEFARLTKSRYPAAVTKTVVKVATA